ncbi:MAG: terpene cyclase/mutase family protein [Dehalococcoidales bacterium]|nr:terpene cyclase/mutase family protein [Dehalococcoidales bacterium]
MLLESVSPIAYVWNLPKVKRILAKQEADGSWKYSGKQPAVYPPHHYSLVETFKRFRILVEKYCFDKTNDAARKAAEYLFTYQTDEGDIRGFIGNQYATYYTGEVLSLLIKAGYGEDERVEKGMQWLLSMRQDDGGWTIPIITHRFDRETQNRLTSEYAAPVEPDRTRPFSHNWTNMVMRAFAAHFRYRHSPEAWIAGNLLKSRFFRPDVYSSYKDALYWTRFQFWWPNLLTAVESLLALGFTGEDPDIKKALDWFIAHQSEDGLWNVSYNKIAADGGKPGDREWLTLAVCRMLKGYSEYHV